MRINIDGKWQFYKTYHDKDYIQSHDTRKHVTLKEKRETSEYRLHNISEKEIIVYRIDGGLIAGNEQKKCDYGIYTEQDVLYLIELKGGDYITALEQILNTIEILLVKPRIAVQQMNVRVVLSKYRVPDLLSSQEKKLNMMLKTKYGKGSILKQTRKLEDTI
jgi:hypothetical protein